MTGRTPLVLDGCRTQPLGSYLKALGVLRLVAAQADEGATAHWTDGRFVLSTTLTADGLVNFFVDGYEPSPVVSPWNGGSGFHPKDNQAGIGPIERSAGPRLAAYRKAITIGRELVRRASEENLRKADLLVRCRAALPDDAVAWMDAAVVMLDEPAFPPLLGTGGNDGRLDFSNNFMQRLLLVLGLGKAPKGSTPEDWFRAALFGTPAAGVKAAVGQFDPGAAGGPNSAPSGAAESTVNPADFVLLVEGSLVAAAGAARRLGSTSKRASMPFTFDASPVGYASAAVGEDGRGELWLPQWSHPASAREITRLFAEARCTWRGRQARSGLDAALAAVTLGVDRGIDRFSRFALVTRNGLATAAVPVGEVAASDRQQLKVLAPVDAWLDRVRRTKNKPHAVTSALWSVEDAMFRAAAGSGAMVVLDVLCALARLDAAVSTATTFHADIPPVDLDATAWLDLIDAAAGSAEVRLAACFASLSDRVPGPLASLRLLLRPVRPLRSDGRGLAWTESAIVPGFGHRPDVQILAAAHSRRFISMESLPCPPGTRPGASRPVFQQGRVARLEDVQLFLHDAIDRRRFRQLLAAFLLLEWRRIGGTRPEQPHRAGDPMPPSFALLAPFFGSPPLPSGTGTLDTRAGGVLLQPEPRWPALLGRTTDDPLDTVIRGAVRRLRIARWHPVVTAAGLSVGGPSPAALSSALLLRLDVGDRGRLLGRVAVPAAEPT